MGAVGWPGGYQVPRRSGFGSMSGAAWPALAVDPKRPYGDMTNVESDMADALDLPVAAGGTRRGSPPEVEARSAALHRTMLAALRVLVRYGTIARTRVVPRGPRETSVLPGSIVRSGPRPASRTRARDRTMTVEVGDAAHGVRLAAARDQPR